MPRQAGLVDEASMIAFALEEDQQLIQDTVRKFAAESIRPQMRELEKARLIPDALRRQFHELGLGLLDMPEAVGGQGMGLVTAALVHEELAYGDPGAAVALWAPHLAAQAILALGDEEQQKRFLGRFAETNAHARLGAVAWADQEPLVEGFSTVAKKDGDGWILDGRKAFVVNGGKADLTVVFAQEAGTSGWEGIGAFVVEAGTPGLKGGERHNLLGLETVHASQISLENCRVSGEHRLRGAKTSDGVKTMFVRWSVVNAARQVGLMRASYEFALDYTQERKAFGKPVAHSQSIAFMLADMAMDVEASRWMVLRGASELEKGRPLAAVEACVHANEAGWRVADNGVQLLGGAGYVKDYPVEKWLRDTKTLALFQPTSEIANLSIASAELAHPVGTGLPSAAIQPFFT
jgi:alkylation response protein AidB-like acyl-CoA dehydrogenase